MGIEKSTMPWKNSQLSLLLSKLRGDPVEYNIKYYKKRCLRVKRRLIELRNLEDEELKRFSLNLAAAAKKGSIPDNLVVDAFALACEACCRVLAMDPFDPQIITGMVLYDGFIAEMATGEGKTLAAVLPAYLRAIEGKGVHILTFNDYLARRDASWMGPVFEYLGLSVGVVFEGMGIEQRQRAYQCDITYGTAKEIGFDFLRDGLRYNKKEIVQRPFHFAIIDEADSILIDEARVPLVIAGQADEEKIDLKHLSAFVKRLRHDIDYKTDEYDRNVFLTPAGIDKSQTELCCSNLFSITNLPLLTNLNLALHAHVLLRRDVDYIVRNGTIEMVDEFTGRIIKNRRWPDGLQSAVEAKEGVSQHEQGVVLGKITLQHLIQHYPKFSGMTATAISSAEEFYNFYGLKVVVIPPNRPCCRIDLPDIVFTHVEAKEKKLVSQIVRVHATGRPILVGTANIQESERIAEALRSFKIPCHILNAKNDDKEADIISSAGNYGAVTISTNMAGRGTDIRLGGKDSERRREIVELRGLLVIGTNRAESERIDYQLRGRAGRQGDPGTSIFYISLEDDLLSRYGIQDLIPEGHLIAKQEKAISDSVIVKEIARTQRIIDAQNFEIRKTLWNYSSLFEKQRKIICQRRFGVLHGFTSALIEKVTIGKRFRSVCSEIGENAARKLIRSIELFHIDRLFVHYIARVADIKEGVQLYNAIGQTPLIGGETPINAYHKLIVIEFEKLINNIDEATIQTFEHVDISDYSTDRWHPPTLNTASTWTYTINDNPFGDLPSRIFRRLSTVLKKRGVAKMRPGAI